MKRKAIRFNIYMPKDDYELLERLCISRKDASFADTIRIAIRMLDFLEQNKTRKEDVVSVLDTYRRLLRAQEDGKDIIIRDPKEGKEINVWLPKF